MPVVYNGTFETDTENWSPSDSSPLVARSTLWANGGTASLMVTPVTNATCAILHTPFTVSPSTSYTMSWRSYAREGSGRAGQLTVNEQTSGGQYITTQSPFMPTVVSTAPGLQSVSFTTGATTGRVEIKVVIYSAATTDRLHFDDMVLETSGANTAPTANAGSDQAVTTGATVTLTGSGNDSDGTIASYAWTLTSKPTSSTATLSGSGTTRTFVADLAGTYVGSLVVTDNLGAASAADTVQVVATTPATPGSGGPVVYVRNAADTGWEKRKWQVRNDADTAWIWE